MKFVLDVVHVFDGARRSNEALYFKDQAFRSAASAALNYGEAQAAESRKDFAHKCAIVLKELRECYVSIRLLNMLDKNLKPGLIPILKENNELISIFVKTVSKAKANKQ